MKKGILYTLMALAMVLCLTIALTAPVAASEVLARKNVVAPFQPNIYYVGETIYYKMEIENPSGNTATNTLKLATVETGAEIRVPLFIENGEKIVVNTADGTYKERAK
jgi:hypothetical protein